MTNVRYFLSICCTHWMERMLLACSQWRGNIFKAKRRRHPWKQIWIAEIFHKNGNGLTNECHLFQRPSKIFKSKNTFISSAGYVLKWWSQKVVYISHFFYYHWKGKRKVISRRKIRWVFESSWDSVELCLKSLVGKLTHAQLEKFFPTWYA